ncbi:ASCH domain-containing protein [Candidatus Chromulinivorax destructor]|uniref:Isomerase n=1 Tax=Candidatus Chromulinivorax destructor TaxID=2066483 RepID=A0A345ZAL0_9BACT|nr:ASCH domain-containing protein [Candidatus Chromulinivorax destructor]AXK60327.1 isomerase [Candidatus Chromulinivorax destructor]
MPMLKLSLRQCYFDAIKSGLKTVEGRLNSHKFKDLRPGMQINFSSIDTHETIICTVASIHVYANFKEMLIHEGLENMLPGVTSLDEGVNLYENFEGYREGVKKVGALAITIQKNL